MAFLTIKFDEYRISQTVILKNQVLIILKFINNILYNRT